MSLQMVWNGMTFLDDNTGLYRQITFENMHMLKVI